MNCKKPLLLFATTLFLFLTACNEVTPNQKTPEYWPTAGWRTAPPAEHGFDGVRLAEIAQSAGETIPFLDSLLIIRDGYIIQESYYNDYDENAQHDIASVTKSWTSALLGMARAEGKLSDLDAPLPNLLPDYFAGEEHADKSEITLRHLLQMRSGIEYNEDALDSGEYGAEELLQGDTTEFGLGFPMAYPPGETWNYSTLDTQIISTIFQRATGQSLASYAAANLFDPLGIENFEWVADGSGTTIGGQNLSMAPRDMAKLGLLFLHDGAWEGEQLVPTEWIELSLTPQGEAYFEPTGQMEIIEWYGLLWWTWKPEWFYGYRSYQARGYGGQQVLVFPELDLIIATTAELPQLNPDAAREQWELIGGDLIHEIFSALTDLELEEQ